MAAQTANLYLLEDLDDVNKTKPLAKSDLDALRKVADWIKSFVVKPTKISDAKGRYVPSCLAPWSAKLFGSLLNTSPTAA